MIMHRFLLVAAALLILSLFAIPAAGQCTKIKDGTISDSAGNTITLGSDQFGYNYQAHLFNGTYDSVDRILDHRYYGSTGDFTDDSLIMKWSDDWLSNLDCNRDGKLDRGGAAGADVNLSKGWLTNQVEGDYIGSDSDSHHYTYFVKIVFDGGAACGTASNPACIWGTFAVIEEVYNDPFGGFHGVDRSKLAKPAGFGFYTN